ncbi:hypothetical protein ACFLQW_04530, partial [Candidatus Zixiibacteriota bacterium]
MAAVYRRMQQPQKVLAYADSAMAINPSSISALTAKFDAYRMLGDSAKMAETRAQISRVCPWLRTE